MTYPKQLLVVDVEATCWRGHPPPGELSEIIEIGLCVFDAAAGEPGEARSILIRPQRSRISPFCTDLTSITPEMAAGGIPFNEACSLLRREYDSAAVVWASWGKDDRWMFEQQCASFRVTYPFGPQHLDLRRWFAMLQRKDRTVKARQVGLMKALNLAGLTYEGRVHRGVDDALNTARLLAAMVRRYGPECLTL
ncbi:MAG TPA: 3'-5' exonuclease [Spirillospora sp.]|nr:3'-5' exonuclease [Spirillospora sp.]